MSTILDRRGLTLLEVVVALTIVTIAGGALVGRVGGAIRQIRLLDAEEKRIDSAHQVLAGLSQLRRAELDRRIGEYPTSGFIASIQRPDPELYRVALLEPEPAGRTLVVTVLYRPREEPR